MYEFFGRSPFFIIKDGDEVKFIENNPSQNNAGVNAAKVMSENNVDVVVSGNFGPKAEDILKQFNIKMMKFEGKIKDVVKKSEEEK